MSTPGQEPPVTPPVGETPPTVPPATPPTPEPPKTFDEAYVKELRAESAKHRTENKQLLERLTALENANKTDAEKLAEKAKLADSLTPEVEKLRTTVASLLEAEKADLPKEMLELMPAGDPADQLEWVRKAKKVKPAGGLPSAGGRNPAGGTDGAQKLQDKDAFDSLVKRNPALQGRVYQG